MPEPKHSFKKKSFEVSEQFIDREEAKELYRNKLNNNEKEYNVLVFYGVGGIGKSKLRKEICRLHKEENDKGVSFYLDLNAPEDRNLGTGILKLVDSCDDKKIDFKCFELAYALYFRKKNPGAQYGREKGFLTDNTFFGISLNIIGIFDSGITGTAAEIVEKTIRAISNRTINNEVKEELKNFDNYSIAEMEEMLPLFFQYDLQSYLKKHKHTKVLIVFDTFEALNENVLEKIHRNKNERWIQDIISYFGIADFPDNKLLTMIFGRDKIEWDQDWMSLLDQYQLKEFEADYSEEYLKKAGIDNEEMVTAIVQSSKGYPFLLYLSAETYANMKNAGKEPTPKDFDGSYAQVIERFIYNLDKDTVEALRLMSIPNYYNVEIFELLIKEYGVSFYMTEFEQFNKYSFVTCDETGKEFYIHDLMRRGILEKTSESLIRQAHQTLLRYFSDKMGKDVVTKYVFGMFYHARKGLTIQEFNEWLDKPVNDKDKLTPIDGMKMQQERGEQRILMQIIEGVLTDYKELPKLKIDLINIYIDTVHLGGDYERAVEICEKYLGQYTDENIFGDEQLIKMRIRKIHHSMFYMPVDGLIAEAKTILEGVNIQRYPEQYNELLFLLGGNLGLLYGDLEEASKWLAMSMDYAQKHGFDAFIHRTIRKQADILLALDDADGALNLINQTVTVDSTKDDINSRYKIYLMGVLGEVYRKIGNLDFAWQCYDIVEKKSSENNLPGWKAHAYLAKGMVEMKRSNFSESETFLEAAFDIYKNINQQWGLINTEEAKILMNRLQGNPADKTEIEKCKKEAKRMHYQYNIKFADLLAGEEIPYLQLFFL
jgi:hypothetical protein